MATQTIGRSLSTPAEKEGLFHERQGSVASCGRHAINNVLQEDKIIEYIDDKRIKYLNPGNTAGTLNDLLTNANCKFNIESLCIDPNPVNFCGLNPPPGRPRNRYQWYSDTALMIAIGELGYNVYDRTTRSADGVQLQADTWVTHCIGLLSQPGFIGAVLNEGNLHYTAITIAANTCRSDDNGNRMYTYIDSMNETVICMNGAELRQFLISKHGRIYGYFAIQYPHDPDRQFYRCQAINNLIASGAPPSSELDRAFLTERDNLTAKQFQSEFTDFVSWAVQQLGGNEVLVNVILGQIMNDTVTDITRKTRLVAELLTRFSEINVDEAPVSVPFKGATFTNRAEIRQLLIRRKGARNAAERHGPFNPGPPVSYIPEPPPAPSGPPPPPPPPPPSSTKTGIPPPATGTASTPAASQKTWKCSMCNRFNPAISEECRACTFKRPAAKPSAASAASAAAAAPAPAPAAGTSWSWGNYMPSASTLGLGAAALGTGLYLGMKRKGGTRRNRDKKKRGKQTRRRNRRRN